MAITAKNKDNKQRGGKAWEYRFTTGILLIFGFLGLLAVALTLVYSLHVSQQNLEQEIENNLEQKQRTLQSLLTNRLELLDIYLKTSLGNQMLGEFLSRQLGLDASADDILFHFRDSAASEVVDLMFVLDTNEALVMDASSPLYPIEHLMGSLEPALLYTSDWRLFSHNGEVYLLKAAPLFDPGSINLQGYVFVGLALSGNPEFQQQVFDQLDVDLIELKARTTPEATGELIFSRTLFTAAADENNPLPNLYMIEKPLRLSAVRGSDKLEVKLGVSEERFEALKASFWNLFALTGGGFLFFLLLAAALLNSTHRRAIDSLLDYIRSIQEGSQVTGFLATGIHEYNRVGRAMEKMVEELKVAGRVFESAEVMLVADADKHLLRVNKAFTEMLGYQQQEVLGQPLDQVLDPEFKQQKQLNEIYLQLEKEGFWQGELESSTQLGDPRLLWLSISAVFSDVDERLLNYVITLMDITERHAAEQQIRHLAYYDQLTGLANRQLLLKELGELLNDPPNRDTWGALIYLDMDDFKTLNDSRGHQVGDYFLKMLAQRLEAVLVMEHRIARIGGDEFVLLIRNLGKNYSPAVEIVQNLAEQLQAHLNGPFVLEGLKHHATVSMGVTLFKLGTSKVETLMQEADLAMYQAKAAGRNTYRFFSPEMLDQVLERAQLVDDLRKALHNKEFLLYYQPQVTDKGEVIGAEALVRWQHPEKGTVSPAAFIPIAEETDLILLLGQQVLETACQQLLDWSSRQGYEHLTLAVNISVRQFQQVDFVEQVTELIQRYAVNPKRLKLEVTESLLMDDEDILLTAEKMEQLQALGVGFSLDDFGTGYSSLTYLKKLPLDQLKIDKSFVSDLLIDAQDLDIARTIVSLGHSLNLAVIAEGVENQEQQERLAALGCFSYQGYFFGRPLPIEAFHQWMENL
ncbi:PAS domain S-box-containing protein/diguanylate cyclase (GGDEF) domain-containing protein [Marinospirillum celere]|uniref:cyclic-guanylate-specific phosphodiesterase n=1 Tax=Marinospirillum celere TaxID=1122252 RepID=A0A1I1GYK7_9GAMM|nr:EAL domain-containing protein [Marinospirillum celere]SFC16605.1 PAS domain S-box-containing protein/diguanylate cyclase (GGDEF) domain-containing protein [Marinospirillum celere]